MSPRRFKLRRNSRQKVSSLRVADLDAEHLSAPVLGHAGGDDHGLGGHLVVLTDVQVGGVEPDVGELGVVQPSLLEGRHHLVQALADAADLGFGDPGLGPQGPHQLVDGSGGDPVDVGLHDHGVEGLVDAPAGLQDRGEEAAFSELGDGELDVAGLGGEHPGAVPVALVGAPVAPLVAIGTDRGGQLGFDQLLADEADCLLDQVEAVSGTERFEQVGQGRLVKGHRCALLRWVRLGTHRGSRRWPPYGWTPRLTSKPTTSRDAGHGIFQARCVRPRSRWIAEGHQRSAGSVGVAYIRCSHPTSEMRKVSEKCHLTWDFGWRRWDSNPRTS